VTDVVTVLPARPARQGPTEGRCWGRSGRGARRCARKSGWAVAIRDLNDHAPRLVAKGLSAPPDFLVSHRE